LNWNVSSFKELCDLELNPGASVPNVNIGKINMLLVKSTVKKHAAAFGRKDIYAADIREWFNPEA
jgi:hypothetical protein